MKKNILKKIEAIVGDAHLTTAREDLMCYSYDSTGMEYMPTAVAFPGSAVEISSIMELANKELFPVIPRGAGTGMTGGSLPIQGGLVLVMSRLNRILEVDVENQVAVVEPGVITGQFQAAVKKEALFYPPDPASRDFCTMGGNVAECSGGPSAVKYGVTRDYVLGLEVVLPDGRLMHTGVRTAKGVVGYDLTRLFIGSEGTLGIITKIVVRLLALPTHKKTYLVLTDSLRQAAMLVSEILKRGILPNTLEYMDQTALHVVREYLSLELPQSTRALLLVEVDGDENSTEEQGKKFLGMLADRRTYPGILGSDRLIMRRKSMIFGRPGAPFLRLHINCGLTRYPRMWWCRKQKFHSSLILPKSSPGSWVLSSSHSGMRETVTFMSISWWTRITRKNTKKVKQQKDCYLNM